MPGLPPFLCAFHVMQSLAKSLQEKVGSKEELKAMSNGLHNMIRINDLGPAGLQLESILTWRIEGSAKKLTQSVRTIQSNSHLCNISSSIGRQEPGKYPIDSDILKI